MTGDDRPAEPALLLVVGADATWSIEGTCNDFTAAAVLRSVANQLDAAYATRTHPTPPATRSTQ
jgi:hypothetical protein